MQRAEVDARRRLARRSTMTSVAWPSTRGPSTLSDGADDGEHDDDDEDGAARAAAGRPRRRTDAPKSSRPLGRACRRRAPAARRPRRLAARRGRPRRRRSSVRSVVGRRSCRAPLADLRLRRSRRRSGRSSSSSSWVPRPTTLAVLEHEDLVGGGDRRHPLGDDHDGGVARCTGRARRGAGRRWRGRGPRTSRRTRRSRACATSARAIDSRWRWPPDTLVPPCSMRASRPPGMARTKSAAWATSSASHISSSVASGLPKRRLLATVPENR